MAIERFREGMSEYLNEVERSRRREIAVRFDSVVSDLRSGTLDSTELEEHARSAVDELAAMHASIIGIRKQIAEFTTRIAEQLQVAGISLPPIEVVQRWPKGDSLASKLGHPWSEVVDRDEDAVMIEKIYRRIGDPDAFVIPQSSGDENPLGPHIKDLNLPVKIYKALARSGRVRIGDILRIDQNMWSGAGDIRNFGTRAKMRTLAALYDFGVVPKEESSLVPQNSVPDQKPTTD